MNKYKVLGEEGASVEINGGSHAVGAVIELDEAVAAPLVEEGKLELVNEDTANGQE